MSLRIFEKFGFLTIFGIAMGFLEAAVVIYLRMICYPEGFSFPLENISNTLFIVEVGRELSTIVMLITIGMIAGRDLLEKICYFLYSFGIWDIFYYFWLKLVLDWPPSLLTWDLLFLVPVPWVGPVLAPILVALTMMILSVGAVYFQESGYFPKVNRWDWALIFLGGLAIFTSFVWDFQRMINYEIPVRYHWVLLLLGESFWLTAFFHICQKRQMKRGLRRNN